MENVDLIEDQIENQACNAAVVRLGNYFSNLTELGQLSQLLKGTSIRNIRFGLLNLFAW